VVVKDNEIIVTSAGHTTSVSIRQKRHLRYTGKKTANTDDIATTFVMYQRSGTTLLPLSNDPPQLARLLVSCLQSESQHLVVVGIRAAPHFKPRDIRPTLR
jgi:hypothetical protein